MRSKPAMKLLGKNGKILASLNHQTRLTGSLSCRSLTVMSAYPPSVGHLPSV